MNVPAKKLSSGYLLISNTIIFFSTFEVVSRTITGIYSPLQINFFRFFTGGLILFVTLYLRKGIHISKKDLILSSLLGVLNIGISMNLLQYSLSVQGAEASLSAVLFSTNPVFVILFASIFGGEKITFKIFAALLVCVAGILVIFYEKLTMSPFSILPAVLALFSSASFGLYTVLGRSLSAKIGSHTMNAYSFLTGSLITAVPVFFLQPRHLVYDTTGIVQLLYLGIAVTGIAYLTYFKGLSIVGAGKGSLVFFLKPVIASILAFFILQETLTVSFIAGTLLIMTGVFISILKRPSSS